MDITIDPWDPSFAESTEVPGSSDDAELSVDIERAVRDWGPIAPGTLVPKRVAVVDGVRRIDARLDVSDGAGGRWPGICLSWAAGAVVCGGSSGANEGDSSRPASIVGAQVGRGFFTAADMEGDCGPYTYRKVTSEDAAELIAAGQNAMAQLEASVAASIEDIDLAILDGTLRGRRTVPGAVAYIKSHQRSYLPSELGSVVAQLKAGERTPVFQLTTTWPRYTWYVRLPGASERGWAGIARLEAADTGKDNDGVEAIALANLASAILPALAARSYKDPRAPQNLTPIAGLERKLKRMLGDSRLLLRQIKIDTALG